VALGVTVEVGSGVPVHIAVGVALEVAVAVKVRVGVAVGVRDGDAVGARVGVSLDVAVGSLPTSNPTGAPWLVAPLGAMATTDNRWKPSISPSGRSSVHVPSSPATVEPIGAPWS
jgi:hypothetical protein